MCGDAHEPEESDEEFARRIEAKVRRFGGMPAFSSLEPLTARALIERVIERLQMDIDDGSRPDQWSMEDMQRNLRAALAAQPGAQPPPSSPDLHGFKRGELANALASLDHIENGSVEFIARFVRAALAAPPSSTP